MTPTGNDGNSTTNMAADEQNQDIGKADDIHDNDDNDVTSNDNSAPANQQPIEHAVCAEEVGASGKLEDDQKVSNKTKSIEVDNVTKPVNIESNDADEKLNSKTEQKVEKITFANERSISPEIDIETGNQTPEAVHYEQTTPTSCHSPRSDFNQSPTSDVTKPKTFHSMPGTHLPLPRFATSLGHASFNAFTGMMTSPSPPGLTSLYAQRPLGGVGSAGLIPAGNVYSQLLEMHRHLRGGGGATGGGGHSSFLHNPYNL